MFLPYSMARTDCLPPFPGLRRLRDRSRKALFKNYIARSAQELKKVFDERSKHNYQIRGNRGRITVLNLLEAYLEMIKVCSMSNEKELLPKRKHVDLFWTDLVKRSLICFTFQRGHAVRRT